MIQLYSINFILAIASAIIMSISPFLITEGLGISITLFAFMEASTELFAMCLRFFSGTIFDKMKDKKKIFIISILFALFGKLFFFYPNSLNIYLSKICDRISNGLFGAPRDAFLANNSINKGRSAAILTSCRSLGCVISPIVIAYVIVDSSSILNKLNYIILSVIVLLSLTLLLSFTLKDKSNIINTNNKFFSLNECKEILVTNKHLLITFSLFFLARFSDGMIALNLKQKGVPAYIYLSTIAIFNIVMIFASFGYGKLIDKKYLNLSINVTILSLVLFNVASLLIPYSVMLFTFISLFLWGTQRIGAQTTFVLAMNKNLENNNKLYLYGSALGIEAVLSGVTNFIGSMLAGYVAYYSNDYIFIYSLVVSMITFAYFNKKINN
jgi:MFS family permease